MIISRARAPPARWQAPVLVLLAAASTASPAPQQVHGATLVVDDGRAQCAGADHLLGLRPGDSDPPNLFSKVAAIQNPLNGVEFHSHSRLHVLRDAFPSSLVKP